MTRAAVAATTNAWASSHRRTRLVLNSSARTEGRRPAFNHLEIELGRVNEIRSRLLLVRHPRGLWGAR